MRHGSNSAKERVQQPPWAFAPKFSMAVLKNAFTGVISLSYLQGNLYTFISRNTNLSLIVPKIYILLNKSGIQQSFSQVFISLSWYKLWQYLKFICHYYTLLQSKQEIQVHPPSKQQLGPTKGRDNLLQNQQREGKKLSREAGWHGQGESLSFQHCSLALYSKQGCRVSTRLSLLGLINSTINSCLNRALTCFFLNTRTCTKGLEVLSGGLLVKQQL